MGGEGWYLDEEGGKAEKIDPRKIKEHGQRRGTFSSATSSEAAMTVSYTCTIGRRRRRRRRPCRAPHTAAHLDRPYRAGTAPPRPLSHPIHLVLSRSPPSPCARAILAAVDARPAPPARQIPAGRSPPPAPGPGPYGFPHPCPGTEAAAGTGARTRAAFAAEAGDKAAGRCSELAARDIRHRETHKGRVGERETGKEGGRDAPR